MEDSAELTIVLTTTSDSPQRDIGREIGSGLPQFLLLRPVPPRGDGVSPLFPKTPVGDLPVVLWLPLWIQRPWLGSCLARRSRPALAMRRWIASGLMLSLGLLLFFGKRSSWGNHRVVTPPTGVDGQ